MIEPDFNIRIGKYKILKLEESMVKKNKKIEKVCLEPIVKTRLFYVLKLSIKSCKNYEY